MANAPAPPDPAELERLAARLERAALEFEDTGRRQVNRAKNLSWTAAAATSFLTNMTNFSHATSQAATALRDIATGLRAGATKLREAQQH